MTHQPSYQAFCQRPDHCTVRGGWNGKFYFDQIIPARCPKCNGHVRIDAILALKTRRDEAEKRAIKDRERQERDDALRAEYEAKRAAILAKQETQVDAIPSA